MDTLLQGGLNINQARWKVKFKPDYINTVLTCDGIGYMELVGKCSRLPNKSYCIYKNTSLTNRN